MGMDLFHMLVFPGLAFLIVFSLLAEYVDRKLHARLQHRVGPPWYQPLADLIKLAAKEELTRAWRIVKCSASPRWWPWPPR